MPRMRKPKLSPAQVKVLRTLAEPGGKAHFVTGIDSYWFLSNHYNRVRFLTMEALISIGLVDLRKDISGEYHSATITPAGLAYLAELEGTENA